VKGVKKNNLEQSDLRPRKSLEQNPGNSTGGNHPSFRDQNSEGLLASCGRTNPNSKKRLSTEEAALYTLELTAAETSTAQRKKVKVKKKKDGKCKVNMRRGDTTGKRRREGVLRGRGGYEREKVKPLLRIHKRSIGR